jgi:CheY-like chemotaxis protein
MPALRERDVVGVPDGDMDDVVSFRSQDVRGPLASMVGCAELIESGDLSYIQRQLYTSIMVREGRRLTALIDNALALQGLESGHRTLDLAPVDLRSLIRRAVAAAGEDQARPIAMHVTGELPLVSADPEAILGALIGFLSNARRFSPDGGLIRIAARADGDMVEVHIRDHGVGINPGALPRVFDKHYRPDREVRSVRPGAGFTLPLNQRVIEQHGGRVLASSNGPGRGAHFQFTLPVARPDAASGDVLIVEDEAGFARLMKAELAAHGLSAIRADDAETAERILAGVTPRAIVLDLALPGLGGEDFLAHIRAPGGVRLPIVVLTADDVVPERFAALETALVMAVLPKEAGAPQAAVALIAQALAPGGPAG